MISSGDDEWNKEKVKKDKNEANKSIFSNLCLHHWADGLFELASSQGQMQTETR